SDTAGRYYALALNAIKDDIDDRTTWHNIGMALHSLSWDDKGYELWTAWSKQSDKFDEDDQRRTWDSFKHDRENGITIGTLISLARKADWDEVKARKDTGYTPIEPAIAELNQTWFKINNYGGYSVVGRFDESGKLDTQKRVEWADAYNDRWVLNLVTGK